MTDWTTLVGGVLGGGAVVGIGTELVKRWRPNADTTADLAMKREAAQDKAADDFRDELRNEVKALRALHEVCEKERKSDIEKCQQDRAYDREQVAALGGQVDFLRKSLDNLATSSANGGTANHARSKKASR